MRNKRALIGGLVVIGLLAAATSALTAQSTIANGTIFVGSVDQTISGITVDNVFYTYDSQNDETSQVRFLVDEHLPAAMNVVAFTWQTGGTPIGQILDPTDPLVAPGLWVDCNQPVDYANADGTVNPAGAHTLVTCDFPAPVADVTSVRLDVQE